MNGKKLFSLFAYGFIFLVGYLFITVAYQDFTLHGAFNWAAITATLVCLIGCWVILGGSIITQCLVIVYSAGLMVTLLMLNEGLRIGSGNARPEVGVLLLSLLVIKKLWWDSLGHPASTKPKSPPAQMSDPSLAHRYPSTLEES